MIKNLRQPLAVFCVYFLLLKNTTLERLLKNWKPKPSTNSALFCALSLWHQISQDILPIKASWYTYSHRVTSQMIGHCFNLYIKYGLIMRYFKWILRPFHIGEMVNILKIIGRGKEAKLYQVCWLCWLILIQA